MISYEKDYTIKMDDFISSLKEGDLLKLESAREKIPSLFKSYRFIDYLLPQLEDSDVKDKLLDYRSEIALPLWKQNIETVTVEKQAVVWKKNHD